MRNTGLTYGEPLRAVSSGVGEREEGDNEGWALRFGERRGGLLEGTLRGSAASLGPEHPSTAPDLQSALSSSCFKDPGVPWPGGQAPGPSAEHREQQARSLSLLPRETRARPGARSQGRRRKGLGRQRLLGDTRVMCWEPLMVPTPAPQRQGGLPPALSTLWAAENPIPLGKERERSNGVWKVTKLGRGGEGEWR